jgi:hypothetical protein
MYGIETCDEIIRLIDDVLAGANCAGELGRLRQEVAETKSTLRKRQAPEIARHFPTPILDPISISAGTRCTQGQLAGEHGRDGPRSRPPS